MSAQALEQILLGNMHNQWLRALAIAGWGWLLEQVLYSLGRGPLRRIAARTGMIR